MPCYICYRCLKKFDRISNYKRHINRLNPCTFYNSDSCDVNINMNNNLLSNEITKYHQSQDLVNPNFSGIFEIIEPKIHEKTEIKPENLEIIDIKIIPENLEIINMKIIPENSEITDMKIIPENSEVDDMKIISKNSRTMEHSVKKKKIIIKKQLINPEEIISDKITDYFCKHCDQFYSTASNLNKHNKRFHGNLFNGDLNHFIIDQSQLKINEKKSMVLIHNRIAELETEIQRLKDQPITIIEQHNQNILQVVCVGSNDNYLDMLTDKWGDYNKALNFIKECALSEIRGDCKLLQQIYFDPSNKIFPIRYIDKHRGKIEFIDENNQMIFDPKGQKLIKRLANNLQNTYLKGVNYLITKNLDNNCCPNKFLEDYDLQCWNQHIYGLSDPSFHKKIISHLEIPSKHKKQFKTIH